jgi:ABC-type transporter Mla MlaB component
VLDISEVAVMPAPPVHLLDRGPHAEIRLGRGLTAQVAASLCRAVAAQVHAGVTVLELHMPEVERIDSVGLAALHQVGAFTAERGVSLRLVPSPALQPALLDAQLLEKFTLAAPRADMP